MSDLADTRYACSGLAHAGHPLCCPDYSASFRSEDSISRLVRNWRNEELTKAIAVTQTLLPSFDTSELVPMDVACCLDCTKIVTKPSAIPGIHTTSTAKVDGARMIPQDAGGAEPLAPGPSRLHLSTEAPIYSHTDLGNTTLKLSTRRGFNAEDFASLRKELWSWRGPELEHLHLDVIGMPCCKTTLPPTRVTSEALVLPMCEARTALLQL